MNIRMFLLLEFKPNDYWIRDFILIKFNNQLRFVPYDGSDWHGDIAATRIKAKKIIEEFSYKFNIPYCKKIFHSGQIFQHNDRCPAFGYFYIPYSENIIKECI